MRQRVGLLEQHLRRLLRGRYIPSSETLIHDPGQLSLDLGTMAPFVVLPALTEVPESSSNVGRTNRRRPRRRPLAAMYPDLKIVGDPHDLEPHEKFDADGTPLVRMGSETSDSLVWDPVEPYIRRTIRYRYGRSDTGEKVTIAPVPDRITPKGILADETIHSVIISHVLDCLPWHRQERISERVGCRIPRSVMCMAWASWCSVMEPLAQAIRARILAQPVIGADSTFIRHQDGSQPRRCRNTSLWGVTDGMAVFFHWTQDQRHHRASEVLGGYAGTLIRDEWEGWKAILTHTSSPELPPADEAGSAVQAGCHSHARRRFVDHQTIDKRAAQMLLLYWQLYQVERDAVERSNTSEQLVDIRMELRTQKSRPIWSKILALASSIRDAEGEQTAMFKAANYIVKYQDNLERFLDDGRLPADNNLTENVLRIVAVLRKNRLFLGRSKEAGPRLATGLTVLRSCVMAGLNPLHYLAEITPVLLDHRRRVAEKRPVGDLTHLIPQLIAGDSSKFSLGSSSIAQVG